MITALRIRNLRSFADSGRIDLAPLTLLTGPNSGGKSTILDSLLIARQTVDSRDLQLPIVVDGIYVNLGSYYDLVHKHETARQLGLEYEFTAGGWPGFAANSTISLSATFDYNKRTLRTYPTEVSYVVSGPDEDQVSGRRVFTKTRIDKNRSRLTIERDGDTAFRRTVETPNKFYVPTNRYFGAPRLKDDSQAIFFLPAMFEQQLDKVFYVGPLRDSPARSYQATLETPQDVGTRGEIAPIAVWASSRTKAERDRVLSLVDKWLRALGMSERLRVRRIRSSYFSLTIEDQVSGIEASVADVGFGVSQVLPVLVQTAFVEPPATLLFEQPEIHLHPAAQLALGDVFVEASRLGQQVIVETHSEHLLRRIQRRIADGQLDESDVAVYYIENTSLGSRVQRIDFDELGRIYHVPDGFFDQGITESIKHVEAMERHASRNR